MSPLINGPSEALDPQHFKLQAYAREEENTETTPHSLAGK